MKVKRVYLILSVMIIFDSCCHLPFVDCFRYPKYFTKDLKENIVLYQSDSTKISIMPIIEKKFNKDFDAVIDSLFIQIDIHNKLQEGIVLNFDIINVDFIKKNKTIRGYCPENNISVLIKSNENRLLKFPIYLENQKNSTFQYEKHKLLISIQNIRLNNVKVQCDKCEFYCKTH